MSDSRRFEVRIGANTAEFDRSISGMNRAITQLKREFTQLNRSTKIDPANLDQLNNKLKNLEQQVQINENKVISLRKEQDALGDGAVKSPEWLALQQEINKTESNIQFLNRQIAQTKLDIDMQPIRELQSEFDGATRKVEILDRALQLDPNNLELSAQKTKAIGQASDVSKRLVSQLEAQQKALGDTGVGSEQWLDLQDQINNAKSQMNQLSNTTKQTGNNAKETNGRFGGLVNGLGKVGLAIGGVQKVTGVLSSTFGNAASQADNVTLGISNLVAVGVDINKVDGYMDRLRATSLKTGKPLADVTDGVKNIYLATGNMDQSMRIYDALSNSVLAFGGSASDAAYVVQNMQRGLQGGTVSAAQFGAMFNRMPAVMTEVQKSLGVATYAELAAAVNEGTISFEDITNEVIRWNEVGSENMLAGNKKIEDGMNNIGGQSQRLSNAINIAKGELMLFAAPAITSMINTLANMVSRLATIVRDFAQSKAGQQITQMFNNMGNILNRVLNGAIKTVIGALQSLTPIFNILGNFIKDVYLIIKNQLIKTFQDLDGELLSKIIPTINAVIRTITPWIQQLANNLIPILGAVLNTIRFTFNNLQSIIRFIVGLVQGDTRLMTSAFDMMRENIRGIIENLWAILTRLFTSLLNAVISIVRNRINDIVNTFRDLPSRIPQVIGTLTNVGSHIINSIRNSLTNAPSRIAQMFRNLASTIRDNLPSFTSVGNTIIRSIIDSLAGLPTRIASSLRSLVTQGINAVGGIAGRVINTVFGSNLLTPLNYQIPAIAGVTNSISNQSNKAITNTLNYYTTVNALTNNNADDIAEIIERRIVRRNKN